MEQVTESADMEFPIVPAGESTPITQTSDGASVFDPQATQQPVYTSHQVVISDQDILRIAAAVKLSLQEDIAKIVSIEVGKADQPLEEKIRHLQTENSKLFLQIDELEQYGRRPLVRVTGVPENQGEDTASLILDITKKAGIELEPDEIINSHRVGNPYKRWTVGQDLARL